LFGKLSISKTDEDFDEISELGKNMLKHVKLNEIKYASIILSIDVETSNGKIAFHIVKGCKTKDYCDGNVASAWRKCKK
jgi:hypothetical protein